MSPALQADSLPSEPPGKIKRKLKFSVAVTSHHLSKFQILCLNDQNPPDLILTFLLFLLLSFIHYFLMYEEASLVAQMVKSLPAMWETQVQTLGWEDPLEKGMAIHSSILAWRIPWAEEPSGYSPCNHNESDMTE